ncbi:OmpA family protein [Marinobacter sp. F3R08]|uniref:OmpA family protein n=1 Tax=Marinobacter sp. F3R08 TaxID=2841559 RepID=UPI001C084412|nr:OmpA family protein [Marinobacter sp. F3R08]MBU2954814.1 OmpA family protein [Marinobacter sp. F3R08]
MKAFNWKMSAVVALMFTPLLALAEERPQECGMEDGCGLQGPRGAMQDESQVQRRPFTTGLPAVPEDSERELPRERLILWQLPGDVLAERTRLLGVNGEIISSVMLDDDLPVVRFESGRSVIPEPDSEALQKLLDRLADKRNLRMRFIGHTDPQRLSKRAQEIYRDNYDLGLQRAQEVGETFRQRLNLGSDQLEFYSRGPDEPLVSNDTLAGMAVNRRVEIEIWYDEVTPVAAPLPLVCSTGSVASDELAPFRISLDGQQQDASEQPGSADDQRCVDVALARDLLQVRYDNLSAKPRLNVVSGPRLAHVGEPVEFRGYSNYLHWIDRAEVRILGRRGVFSQPDVLATVTLDEHLEGEWVPTGELPERVYYQLRVYDTEDRFDETSVRSLNVSHSPMTDEEAEDAKADLLAGYGESRLQRHRIPVAGGTVTVNGKKIKSDQQVYVMGRPVPVDQKGHFASSQIIPRGLHSVEVAVLDNEGKGRIYRRDLRLPAKDWFTVAIADITVGQQNTTGPARLVTGEDRYYDDKLYVDGRLAFYTKGKIDNKYTVTASVDTTEESFSSILSNFNDKNPSEFLRRMDSDQGWTTFGDDSTLVEDAPTRGKFYLKVEDGKSHAMWGNFREEIRATELSQIDRSLYGAQLRFNSDDYTAFGERRLQIEGFAAQPGTASAREEFRGTGGSLYFLKHQDLTEGSERVRIEVRDQDSNLVLYSQDLVSGIDYDVNALQGRIILSEPLSSTVDGSLLVRSGGSLSGNAAYLVVGYEYSPGVDELDDIAVGGRAAYWASDWARIGVTGSRQEQTGSDTQELAGVDVLLRQSDSSWIKLESAQSTGDGFEQFTSFDGGFGFSSSVVGTTSDARAHRLETAFSLRDLGSENEGGGTFYFEQRDAGFSAPGRLTSLDTQQVGGSFTAPVGDDTEVIVKADELDEDGGTLKRSAEAAIAHDLDENWQLSAGIRADDQETQVGTNDGSRNDLLVQALYRDNEDWSVYGFTQGTLDRSGTRSANNRGGVGGHYRINPRTSLSGEISDGNLGVGGKAGVNYDASDRTNLYLNYELDNDRTDDGFGGRTSQIVTGARSRWTNTVSVYAEQRYQDASEQSGLIQAYGLDFAPNDNWSYGLNTEFGTINSELGDELRRRALGGKIGYSGEEVLYAGALEYREDKTDAETRDVWLMRNNFSYRINPEWRFISKLDLSIGNSTLGDFFDGNFVEGSVGYAYRPVFNDRLNLLTKYTYLSDLAPSEQLSSSTGSTIDYSQRSHVFAIDGIYDLTERWSVGGRYAYRLSELRMSRDDSAEWFDSRGQLAALRLDWHVTRKWDLMTEIRRRDEYAADDTRTGALVGVYHHFGNHLKAGLGYNFSDFSDDLTDMSFRTQGWFINAVGKY